MSLRVTLSLPLVALGLLSACEDSGGTSADTSTANDLSQESDSGNNQACPAESACDDGDACTENDRCDADGKCVGSLKSCDDGASCTVDRCEAGSCVNEVTSGFCADGATCIAVGSNDPANPCRTCAIEEGEAKLVTRSDNSPCSDGNACTLDDVCQSGACVGGRPRECSSGDVCITASCDEALGCVESASTASCDDGNPCTVGDTCADKACQAGGQPLDCDDDNPCTIDACDPVLGCTHDAFAKCNDEDPCTNDSCIVATGACVNEAFLGACDDGEPCTTGETCEADGLCDGGAPTSCDDVNVCTTDACIPGEGCVNLFRNEDCSGDSCGPATCDDGEPCTINDRCVAGECFGGKTESCPICVVEATDRANKIVSLLVMADGNPGSGLDIDNDPTTCSPSSDCGGGVDNALSVLASFVNPGITDSIEAGVVKWLIDFREARADGSDFPMSVYDSGLAWGFQDCDFQNDTCFYDVASLSLNPECKPYFAFENARIEDGRLTAGGTGELISMVLPLSNDELLAVTIAESRAEANVTFDAQGRIASVNGIIAGAIPKSQLIDAVRGLDPNNFSLPGMTPDEAADLLDLLIESDIDLDGDGLPEAASVAMRIATIPAAIVTSF